MRLAIALALVLTANLGFAASAAPQAAPEVVHVTGGQIDLIERAIDEVIAQYERDAQRSDFTATYARAGNVITIYVSVATRREIATHPLTPPRLYTISANVGEPMHVSRDIGAATER